MHVRRNNRRLSLSSQQLLVEPVKAPMLIIAGVASKSIAAWSTSTAPRTRCRNPMSVPERGRVKLMELGKNEEDLAHNLVAGVHQIQGGQRSEGLMVVALILAPLFVFWLKGAFN